LPPNVVWWRTIAASLAVCAASGVALWRETDGFRAFTSEQARRMAIARSPRLVPAVLLEDQDGHPFTFAAYRGHAVAVDFVYTRCQSLCTLLSTGFQRLDRAEGARPDSERLPLLSISFDPLRDTPARLRAYAVRYGADGHGWRFARVRDARDLRVLLDAFGIVVIPDGAGDYQHNAAVHLLNADGKLARVLDAGATPDEVTRVAAASNR
jgi:protein SCO1